MIVQAVDKSKFRTCNEQTFCRENLRPDTQSHQLCIYEQESLEKIESSGTFHGKLLFFKSSQEQDSIRVPFFITIYENSMIRFWLQDSEKRYSLGSEVIQHVPQMIQHVQMRHEQNMTRLYWKDDDNNSFQLQIHHNPFLITFINNDRNILIVNEHNKILFKQKSHSSLEHSFLPVGFDVTFPNTKHLFGIPEHATSFHLPATKRQMNETSHEYISDPYRLYNLDVFEYELNSPMALYGSIPFLLSHNPFDSVGVFWANPSDTWIDIVYRDSDISHGNPSSYSQWVSESGMFDLYIFSGTPKIVLSKYTRLTGKPLLPPIFSLGYHQCRWNYEDEKDVELVSNSFDSWDIPMDVIWLDIEHTNGKRYLTWDNSKFPSPTKMQNYLAEHGRKLVTIVDPHIKLDSDYFVYSEALNNDLLVKKEDGSDPFEGHCWSGSSVWVDYLNPLAREWWATLFSLDKYIGSTKYLYIWNDMNEPSVFSGPEITMPKDLVHNCNGSAIKHGELHNIYGMYFHMSTVQGILERGQRPFVLTRSFFAGSQKYGAVWTGDNFAGWDHLRISLPMMLSISISGLHFVGADVGGFFDKSMTMDQELMTRWFQVGAFSPFFRSHSHIDAIRREPYLLTEPALSNVIQAIKTRYMLLYYWYTLFYEASKTGCPSLRPLFFEFPASKECYSLENQVMIGSNIMFSPVMTAGEAKISIFFPGSSDGGKETWYYGQDVLNSVWKPTSFSSIGDFKEIAIPGLNFIPFFFKSRSIVPIKQRHRRSSSLMNFDPFSLIVILNDDTMDAKGTLYIDDLGDPDNVQSDQYQYIEFSASWNSYLDIKSELIEGDLELNLFKNKLLLSGMLESVKIIIPDSIVSSHSLSDANIWSIEYLKSSGSSNCYAEYHENVLIIHRPFVSMDQPWHIRISF